MSEQNWRDEVIDFAVAFASLRVTKSNDDPPRVKIGLRRSISDLMFTLGHYFAQNTQKYHAISMADRLRLVAAVAGYIADRLED